MRIKSFLAIALAAALPLAANAHKAWLLPSETVVAGEAPWITVDGAVSNDLFYFNHQPLRIDNLVITAPDGSTLAPQNAFTGRYRSVFDLQLNQQGTYRIAVANSGMFATWEEDGQMKRCCRPPQTFEKDVPKNAEKLQVTQNANRVETFVTLGAPGTEALKPTGKGLELVPVTHPNDLFAGDTANFKLLIDGEPAANTKVEIIPGGTRYRNSVGEIFATTDKDGAFSVTWPAPGMYWLESVYEDDKGVKPATARRAAYVATLEVLPQ